MSKGIATIARRPARLAALAVIGLIAVTFVGLGHASPSNFVERDGNVRFDGLAGSTYDWANGPSPACTFDATTGVVSCPGTGGLFDGGIYNGQNTPPTAPDPTAALLADTSIKAFTFEVDPLGSDTTAACGKGDPTVYTGAGGEKNGDVINTETFATASVPPKDEISNVYAIAHQSGGANEIFFGVERVVNDGDSHIDLEFLQSEVTIPNACSGTFSGDRSQGDFVASFEFTKGGTLGSPTLHVWMCNTGGPGPGQPPTGTVCNVKGDVIDFPSTGGTATGPHYEAVTSGTVFSNVNTNVNSGGPTDCGGWACRLGSGNTEGLRTPTIDTNEFFEGGIDLGGIGFTGCISTFIPHTRSSQSFTATLKDFAIIPFNTCRGSIVIRKEDGNGDLLPGAGFEFDVDPFTGSGGPVQIDDGGAEDKADGDDGLVCIDDVVPGTYEITEYKVPSGYEGDPDTETVTVSSSSGSTCADRLAGTVTPDATFTNLLGSILIHKEDGAGNDLAGAGFTFDPDPFTGGAAVEILDGATEDQADDDDGWLCIDNVLLDTYDITETTVPDGYAGDADTETVTVDSASTCADRLAEATLTPDATFTNLLGSILIHKEDGAGNDLAGAGFTFDVNPFTGGAAVEILDGATEDQADDDDGWLCIDNVLLGSYDITETTVPSGYEGDPDTETVTVNSGSTCADRLAEATLSPDATFTNLLGSILIHKEDGAGNDLAGAGFTFDPDPFTGGAAVEILDGATEDQADDDDGWLCIDNVLLGSYDITETTVPDGYAGDPDTETVTVDSASTCADRLADTPTADATFTNLLGSILIHKVDGAGNDLAGAGFTFDVNPFTGGAAVEILDGSADDQADDDDGWLCIDNVRLGSYDITETTVPAGYAGDTDTETVTVSTGSTCADRLADTPTADATFVNRLGSIIIKKVDGDGVQLAGAGFTFDVNPFTGGAATEIKDGDAADKADANDGMLCIDNVRLGTYHVTETTVPSGFFGDTSTKTITVSSASTCATRLADTPTADATFTNEKGSLIIHKVAKDKNAELGVAPLGGATFTITPNPLTGTGSLDITDDGTNDVFDTAAGVICIDDVWNLGAGNSYSIVEKTAPANYQKDADTETVGVHSPSTCEERTVSGTPDATFTNIPLSQIEVIFTSSAGSGVTEATIVCADSSGIPLSFTSGSNPDLDKIFAGLPPGTYDCQIVIDP